MLKFQSFTFSGTKVTLFKKTTKFSNEKFIKSEDRNNELFELNEFALRRSPIMHYAL